MRTQQWRSSLFNVHVFSFFNVVVAFFFFSSLFLLLFSPLLVSKLIEQSDRHTCICEKKKTTRKREERGHVERILSQRYADMQTKNEREREKERARTNEQSRSRKAWSGDICMYIWLKKQGNSWVSIKVDHDNFSSHTNIWLDDRARARNYSARWVLEDNRDPCKKWQNSLSITSTNPMRARIENWTKD